MTLDNTKPPKRRWMNPAWMPLLHLEVEIPFVSLRTALMYYHHESTDCSYVLLEGRLWKWRVNFDLWGRRFR